MAESMSFMSQECKNNCSRRLCAMPFLDRDYATRKVMSCSLVICFTAIIESHTTTLRLCISHRQYCSGLSGRQSLPRDKWMSRSLSLVEDCQ